MPRRSHCPAPTCGDARLPRRPAGLRCRHLDWHREMQLQAVTPWQARPQRRLPKTTPAPASTAMGPPPACACRLGLRRAVGAAWTATPSRLRPGHPNQPPRLRWDPRPQAEAKKYAARTRSAVYVGQLLQQLLYNHMRKAKVLGPRHIDPLPPPRFRRPIADADHDLAPRSRRAFPEEG